MGFKTFFANVACMSLEMQIYLRANRPGFALSNMENVTAKIPAAGHVMFNKAWDYLLILIKGYGW